MSNSHTPIEDLIDEIQEWLEELEDLIGDQEDLDDRDKDEVKTRLKSVEAHIDLILDPGQPPSLNPPNAGQPDPNVDPSTLPEYAAEANTLATEARNEVHQAAPDHGIIGSRLKTIKAILPGYRSAAGIS